MRRCGLVRITPVVAGVAPVPCNLSARGHRTATLSGKIRDILLLTICLTTLILLSSCGTSNNSSSSSSGGGVSVVSGSGQSAVVGAAFSAHLVAKVTIGGSAASGVAVTFAAPSSGASGTFANGKATESDTTDANGLATSSVFTANTTTGQYAVTATATASGQSASANFGLANTAAPVLVVNAANGSLQTALVGTSFTLPLSVVVDQDGLPVSGVTVTFTAPSSLAGGTFANGQTTETDVTNSQGIATSSTFTANSAVGQYQVTASISAGATANLILTNTSAAQLNLAVANGSLQSANVGTAFGTPLQVRVAISGTGIPGVTVIFAAPATGATGTFSNQTATESDVTDSNGLATASTFTANSIVGQYQVAASIPGGSTANLILTNTAPSGVPGAIQAVGGTPQTTTVGQPFGSQLTAVVVDGTGAQLPGVSVTFTVPTSGASATFAGGKLTETDITATNGVATSSILTANSTTGTFAVNAAVVGVAAPATFTLTNQNPAPFAIIATGGTPQRTAVGSPFSTDLVATVVDAAGNPMSGVAVNFAAPLSGASGTFPGGTTVTTDSNGNASAAFTANSTAGAYNVTAIVGALTPANFALMNTVSGVTAYTFYLSGQELLNDANGINFYSIAGTVLVDPSGNVVGGEEDYNDAAGFTFSNIGITSGTLSFNGVDPNGQGTLTLLTNNSQIGSSGTETFKVQFVNNNHALIVQFDGIAGTSSGSLDTQTLAAPSGGYAFALSGVDPNYAPVGFAGVFASGGGNLLNPQWPGTLDVSDAPSPGLGIQTAIPFTASLGTMDVYGRGVITGINIPVTGQASQNLNIAYYLIGAKAMRFIDIDSTLAAAGSAFSQGTNATSSSNAGLGQSVFTIAGNTNPKNTTYFAALGQFSTSNTSSLTADLAGVADEDELAKPFAQAVAITGTYQVQPNGYGNLSITSGNLGSINSLGMYFTDPTLNLNDPNNTSTGLGGALLLDLDATLTGGIGLITPQTDTAPSAFSGNYAVGWQDINQLDGILYAPREFDMLAQGPMVANGALNLTGVISDPFETLANEGTLSTGDTCQSKPKADNNGTGRYSMLEANRPQNPLNCVLNFGTAVYPNFEVIMYQATGTQLFWYQRSLEPLRPAQLFLGPVEQQGSLNRIPAARKANGTLKSRETAEGAKPDAQ